jgi:hypothetical protein
MYRKKFTEATYVGLILIGIWIILAAIVIGSDFNEHEYNQYRGITSFILLLIRIVAVVWTINLSQRLERNPWTWGFFTLITPHLSLIILGQQKSKEYVNEISQERKTIENNKANLYSLWSNGFITDTEYKEKFDDIREQEKIADKKEMDERVKAIVNERIKPYLDELFHLYQSNLLSEEEYRDKKNELIEKYTNKVKQELSANDYNKQNYTVNAYQSDKASENNINYNRGVNPHI